MTKCFACVIALMVVVCMAPAWVLAQAVPPGVPVRVGWNVDIHQNKFPPPDYANDFHIWGVLESWGVAPTLNSQVSFATAGPPTWQPMPVPPLPPQTFETFNHVIGGPVPANRPLPPFVPPPVAPFYFFEASWATAGQVPFCNWWHFGLDFTEYGPNVGYWLQGVWTKDGVDPAGNPLVGFKVAKDGQGRDYIRISNSSGVEITEILQMDLMVLGSADNDFPLADLNTYFFETHPTWNAQWKSVPAALLPAFLPSGDYQVDSFFDVFLDQVPGLGPLPPGGLLLAREHMTYATSTGGPTDGANGVEDFWQYELHGVVPEPATMLLLAAGAGGLLAIRRRRRAH